MTTLEQARSVEAGRVERALQELETREELKLSRIEAEMSRRGLQNSDARLHAIFEARLERLNEVIRQRIAIRKELVRNYPELGSAAELNLLQEVIRADVSHLRTECKKHSLVAPPEVFAELHARAQAGIERLRQQTPLQLRIEPKLPPLTLNISAGSAGKAEVRSGPRPVSSPGIGPRSAHSVEDRVPASPDAISRKADEAISDLEERNRQLAGTLRRLAAALQQSKQLPDERTVYLEQVQFLAEQAARVSVLRRVSVVKGIMVALRAELDEVPSVGLALRASFPLLASHFGIRDASRQAGL